MTNREITDPEVKHLADIAAKLEPDYLSGESAWIGSPFLWIKHQPSRRVGKIGEQLVAGWCDAKELDVTGPPNSDCDRVIAGLRAEIKFSTMWQGGGFVFQQIRDQDYDVVICLGLYPFDAMCWVIPKAVLQQQPEGVTPQHGGKAGTDTLWLRFDPDNVPEWMHEWGGSLSEAHEVLCRLAT